MPQKRNAASSQNTFLDTIATRFDGIHSNFVLGNAQANGWPIVYCSDGFCELTGFSRASVMAKGSGCRFLYGPETSEAEVQKIQEALEEKRELKTELQFYNKNGTPFWCLLDIVPIKNEKRDVVLFLVSHKDITKDKEKKEPDSLSGKSNSDGSSDEDNENEDEGMPENYDYGRRRSRAVLYHISGQLNKHNKAKSKLQQLNRLASQMPEYKVQEVKKSGLIIVHYGIFKIGWDWLILLCTFYLAIMVPFNAAFKRDARFVYFDAGVEVLFAIDIVLNFRTTFLNKSGQVVYDSRLIALNYIRGWFLLDLLAAIPFDVMYAFSGETEDSNNSMLTMVHLLKLARLLRLARLLQKLERYNQYSVVVLALLMCMFALLAHWLACIWYAIGKAELDENDANWTVGWLYELSERLENVIINKTHNIPDIATSYLTALYFTCSSLTSVGFGNVSANTNPEKIFSVCAMLVGAIMHAVVFGNVTTIIQRMYARRATFHSKTKDLKDFFRIHHIPKPLKHRMRDYFQAMWSINNGIDFKEILKDFPEDMRGEIAIHLHREILSLPIFQQSPPGCLKSVSLQTERFVCGPGEFIMHKGDAVNYLYYVCSGSMEVLKDEQVVAILGKGDIFGTDLDYDDPVSISGCDVRSLAYCELLCIQVKGLVDALLLYPDFAETFSTELPNDLTYNVREGHEDHSDDESLTTAPVITLPSISEDEEEEDEDNNNDLTSKKRSRPTKLVKAREDHDDEGGEGRGNTSTSPLLNQLNRESSSNEWLAGRGKLPNGHIGATLSISEKRLEMDEAPAGHTASPLASSVPTTPTQPPSFIPTRSKPNIPPPLLSALALRRTASGGSRLIHRRSREKLKSCRTLPTLNSVSSDRSIEQVMVHTLQMELEGTRDSVIGLERRLDDLHDDLSNIARNVNSLLRLVSSSPSPSNMYMSSNSLHPSFNPSPSPNPNLYPAPSFYFSQSTDGGDTRDTVSLQSASSPAPDWPGYLSQGKAPEHFLSPFQTSKLGFGVAGGSPSPLASPRVNFSPINFSSLSRQSVYSLNNDRIPLSDIRGEKSGGMKHSSIQRCEKMPPPVGSHLASQLQSSTVSGKESGIASQLAALSQRPSNLSPLHSRRAKSLFIKPTRSLDSNGVKNQEMSVATTTASASLDLTPSGAGGLDKKDLSPLNLDTGVNQFQSEYYQLTQLEPCDARSGHCDKASALRQSDLELSFSSDSPQFDISTTEDDNSGRPEVSKGTSNGTSSSRSSSSISESRRRTRKIMQSPTNKVSAKSFSSMSPIDMPKDLDLHSSKSSSKSASLSSPHSNKSSPSSALPLLSGLNLGTAATRPKTLSSSPLSTAPGIVSPTIFSDIEYIDAEPEVRPCSHRPPRRHIPPLSQLPVFTSGVSPTLPSSAPAAVLTRSKSFSTSALHQGPKEQRTLSNPLTFAHSQNFVAPLSQAESLSDFDSDKSKA
ncbi:potassium voltage-gated channel subfamily H member 8-like isoform X3 [Biomphalaria glabrata]|uniref:Voltage-gated inwardly rectifying potassium channel KCNH3 n=1 Tax=Biomphalaria glabrata TaxID=6526 RepID=A0A9W2Z797_BIOGL|nr:potassium voltage-gated channel subfamily H member 8-like isoform X3 [Biomphalaria glabrata]